jgi:glycerol-3-phosphate dehydrogenase
VRAERTDVWKLILNARGQRDVITARILVNVAGAWVETVAETVMRQPPRRHLQLDKGSHIVVRRLYDHDRAYILQAADRRVVFTIPFAQDFTLIGTTDQTFTGNLAAVAPTGEEISYLCGVVNEYFRTTISAGDVVWAFAGVRSLYSDGAAKPQDIGREYEIFLDERFGEAPLLTVYGGKITTYRRLAEDALNRLAHFFPRSRPWSVDGSLPGGDFPFDGFDVLLKSTQDRWPFLTDAHAERLTRAYGTRIENVLKDARRIDDLGQRFGADLTAAEVRYLMQKEWAMAPDDILWRRSKLGLRFTDAQREALGLFMNQTAAYLIAQILAIQFIAILSRCSAKCRCRRMC